MERITGALKQEKFDSAIRHRMVEFLYARLPG
jgi:hypothetical protein